MKRSYENEDGIMVKFNIPIECPCVGKINEFGKSEYSEEKESIFPLYTAVRMNQRTDNYILVDVI